MYPKLEDGEAEVVKPQSTNLGVRFLKDLAAYKASLVIVLAPLLGSPLLFLNSKEATCSWVVLVMALYWMFEVMPLAATAFLPTFLFPMLGLVPSKEICKQYLPDINFLFIGGLIIAVAVEKCNLHQRIALRVLTIVGSKPQWIMLGFMSVTAFLSMWISNTATTAMMVPIAQSVIYQLLKYSLDKRRNPAPPPEGEQNPNDEMAMSLVRHEIEKDKPAEGKKEEEEEEGGEIDYNLLTPQELSMAKGLLICIAFGANIGGTGTLTGTPPNLVMAGLLGKIYPEAEKTPDGTGISYLSWMLFAIPCMIVSLLMCWACLAIYFLGFKVLRKSEGDPSVNRMLNNKFRSLPPMSFAEWSVMIMFLLLLLMWLTRDPKFVDGFGKLFEDVSNVTKGCSLKELKEAGCDGTVVTETKVTKYFSDATSAMFIATILFMLPNQLPTFLCFRNRDRTKDPTIRGALMDWPSMQAKFPWSVVMLLGGGFALAHGVKKSGLSALVGDLLSTLEGTETFIVQLICVIVTMIITNICSNTVTATIFVPIVAGLASRVKTHPLAFVLPTTLACSYAFTLPVATPPNAIVFASGVIRVSDLMKSGLLISFFSTIIIVINMQTYAYLIYPLNTFPEWANSTAAT